MLLPSHSVAMFWPRTCGRAHERAKSANGCKRLTAVFVRAVPPRDDRCAFYLQPRNACAGIPPAPNTRSRLGRGALLV